MQCKSAIVFLFIATLTCGLNSFGISLKDYARKNEIKVEITGDGTTPMPKLHRRDQINNFHKGGRAISLSEKNLSDLNGISKLKVTFKGKSIPITEVDDLQLFLNRNDISEIPDEIKDLKNVTYIYFIQNKIKTIPLAISKMTGLEGVYFTKNKLTEIPDFIYDMTFLRKFEIEDNQVSFVSPKIGQLKELIHLKLAKNKIKKLPSTVGNLKKLRVCDFSDNQIEELPKGFENIKVEYLLRLNGNPLRSIPEKLFEIHGVINIEDTNINPKNYTAKQQQKFGTEKKKGK